MNTERITQLKQAFEGKMPETTKEYTNKEVLEMLLSMQNTMITGVYEQTHAEAMKDKDLMIHFGALAEQYGLTDTAVYKRYTQNMQELNRTIGRIKAGMKGEQNARKILKMLSYDKNVKLLYNVCLKNEDMQTEYDAIVIAPYGLFIIEVKNWNASMVLDKDGFLKRDDLEDTKYNVLARMSIKEALLRECLGEAFPEVHEELLLFSKEKADVRDDYKKIILCYGAGVVKRIEDYKNSGLHLRESQINEMVKKITSCNVDTKGVCKVKCDEIVEDYAILMAAIEDAAKGIQESILGLERIKAESIEISTYSCSKKLLKKQKNKLLVGIAGIAAGLTFGIWATGLVLSKNN